MNDHIAMKTLEDHKYLLIEVQNRAAIAFFAAANRNLSLYNALKKHQNYEMEIEEAEEYQEEDSSHDVSSTGGANDKSPGLGVTLT